MLADGGMPDRAITTWRSHMPLFDFAAFDAQGNRFAGVFTDCGLGQGSGARGTQDGIDTGSGSEPEVTVPNVETNELALPVALPVQAAGPRFCRGRSTSRRSRDRGRPHASRRRRDRFTSLPQSWTGLPEQSALRWRVSGQRQRSAGLQAGARSRFNRRGRKLADPR